MSYVTDHGAACVAALQDKGQTMLYVSRKMHFGWVRFHVNCLEVVLMLWDRMGDYIIRPYEGQTKDLLDLWIARRAFW